MYNFFRYRYIKSDLTQSGMLTVALLFFSAKQPKLSNFPRVERKGERSKQVQKCDFAIFKTKTKNRFFSYNCQYIHIFYILTIERAKLYYLAKHLRKAISLNHFSKDLK